MTKSILTIIITFSIYLITKINKSMKKIFTLIAAMLMSANLFAAETIIWEGDGSAGAVSWNGIYRFALEGHDGNNECIAEIPQATWDKMLTETFYAVIQGENPQIRITTGWWDTNLTAADIQPGNELLTDNGDGTWTIKVNLADNPDLVALLVDHHLLFTGDKYTLMKLYFVEAPAGDIWTVAGNFVGSSWNPEDTANDMTLEDGIYKLVKTDVLLEKGVSYEFKVVKDHAWTEAYPGSNYTFTVEETAIYTVTITFNAETQEITVTTVKTGEAQAVDHAYSVRGTIGGDAWEVDYDMTKGEDGIYTYTFENVAAGNYEFKVRVDHDWSVSYPGSNYTLTVDQDGSTVIITFNEETKEVNATVTAPAEETPGTIWEGDGSAGAVSWNGIYRFALEGHDGANECIAEIPQAIWDKMMTETFYADIQAEDPQVRITTGWWDTNLTAADIQPGNELLTDNGDGTWTIKVNLADNPDLVALLVDHHLLFTGDRYTLLKLYFKDATGIQAPTVNQKAVNGAIYNLAGQKVGANYKGIVIVNGKKVLMK